MMWWPRWTNFCFVKGFAHVLLTLECRLMLQCATVCKRRSLRDPEPSFSRSVVIRTESTGRTREGPGATWIRASGPLLDNA